ncbi:MAG TPA: hypothetical protein VM100_00620, partial [Longimicrobiales bacterium]|nr:hypothetical protein [Longimicrobiales bacterium]
MKHYMKAVFALAAITTIAACEKKAEDDAVPADTAAAPAATAPQVNMEPVTIDLDEVKDSGVKGEATATHSNDQVTVSIVLKEGAKPDA